jgi:N-acetylmuramoyl-L-alanine amidase
LRKRKQISLFICLIFIMGLMVSTGPKVKATTNTVISYTVSKSNIRPEETFDISVRASSLTDLYGASIDFKYDPSLIQVTGIERGTVFPSNTTYSQSPINDPINGMISLFVLAQGNVPGITNTAGGELFVIRAKALKQGQLNLNTTNNSSSLTNTGSNVCIKLSNSSALPISYTSQALNIPISDSISFNSITFDKVSPQPAGSTIRITANTTGGSNVTYRFSISDGTSWVMVQDFSSQKHFDWKPTKGGNYRVSINAKDATSYVTQTANFSISEAQLVFNSITTNKLSPQDLGSTIRITANTTGGTNVTYRFSVSDGITWTTVRDFSSSNFYDWKPDKPGNYRIAVNARDSQSYFTQTINYTINESQLTFNSITTDKVSPQNLGSTVRITANTTGGTNVTYRFSVSDGVTWTTVRDFSSSSFYDWKPDKPGNYRIAVNARDSKSYFTQTINYTIESPLVFNSITPDKASPQNLGSTVRLTANTTGGSNVTYRFSVSDGTAWTTVRDFSSSNFYDWKPDKPGNYRIAVNARDSKSYFTQTINYTIESPLVFNSITADKASPQNLGSTIRLRANTTGGTNVTYRFSVSDGTSWVTVQDFSSSNFYDWKPTKPGNYRISVNARDSKSYITQTLNYSIVSSPLTFNSITYDKASPQLVGNTIKIAANTTGGSNVKYRFWANDGTGWVLIQDYSSSNLCNWTPSKPGNYRISVNATDATSYITLTDNYEISSGLTFNSITFDKQSPQTVGSTINITANTTGGTNVKYRFWVNDGTGWVLIQDYSSLSNCTWKPTKAGTYRISINVMDATSYITMTSQYTIQP